MNAQEIKYQYNRVDFIPKTIKAAQLGNGSLKEIHAINYKYQNGIPVEEGYTHWQFNPHTLLVDFSWEIQGKGDRYIHSFDNNNILLKTEWQNSVNQNLYTTTLYEYEKNGLLEIIKVINKDGDIMNKYIYSYEDGNKYPSKVNYYSNHSEIIDGKVQSSLKLNEIKKCLYDSLNNLTFIHTYDNNDKHQISIMLSYDKNNRCIGEGAYFIEPVLTYQYDIDELSNITACYNAKTKELYRKNTYSANKLVHSYQYENNRIATETEWEYDNRGNVISEITKKNDEVVLNKSISYTYDSLGNFITKLVIENGAKKSSEKRTYQYY